MRTKRLRRWVAGLWVTAALGVGALALGEMTYVAQEITWGSSIMMVTVDHGPA